MIQINKKDLENVLYEYLSLIFRTYSNISDNAVDTYAVMYSDDIFNKILEISNNPSIQINSVTSDENESN